MDKELQNKVIEALNTIRPFLKNDGGDIELVEIKHDTVFVKLLGTCSECPINTSTMKIGIENTIKQYVPSIRKVVSI